MNEAGNSLTRSDILNAAWSAAESKCSGGCSECALAIIDGPEKCPCFLLRRCVNMLRHDEVTMNALIKGAIIHV